MFRVTVRADDTTFGVLRSRFHESWSLRMCTWLGKENDPRYTPTTTFETFPFPAGLAPADNDMRWGHGRPSRSASKMVGFPVVVLPPVVPQRRPAALAIAAATHRLNALRENVLNPPEWVKRESEVVPGYPDRLIPVDEQASRELKRRTLTNLYNQRSAWLVHAHRTSDAAVAAACGWVAIPRRRPTRRS